MTLRYLFAILALGVAGTTLLPAQTLPFIDPNFSGITQYDGWENLNAVAYPPPTYPHYTSTDPFSIASNQPGSNGAMLNKVSGAGGPMDPDLGNYIYVFGGMSSDATVTTASFSITDSAVVSGLQNVFLQTMMVGASTLPGGEYMEFSNGIFPVLNYNGGIQNLVATNTFYFGEIDVEGIGFGDGTIFHRGFQWDLSGILDPVTSIEITWNNSPHSQIYGVQLDQSDTYSVIPEPSVFALVFLALLCGVICYRNRVLFSEKL